MRRTLLLTSLAVFACFGTAAHADGLNWSLLLGGADEGGGIILRPAPPPVYIVVPSPRGAYERPYRYDDEGDYRDYRGDWRDREARRHWRAQRDRQYAYRHQYRRGDDYRDGGDD